MLLLAFLLVPAVLAGERELHVHNYVVKIKDNTLQSVRETSESTDVLDLSKLGLQGLKHNVFNHLSNVKTLNLANNSLSSIPQSAFANLANLEHLNLANNKISGFDRAFVGLSNLKTLNLANNPLERLERGSLYGLTIATDVYVRSDTLASLSTGVFENPSTDNVNPSTPSVEESHRRVGFKYNPAVLGPSALSTPPPTTEVKPANPILRVKVCIEHGKLKSLESRTKGEKLSSHCRKLDVENGLGKLSLRNLGIREFATNWYRLHDLAIHAIDLDDNKIVKVTSQLLNELPASITEVTLRRNRIERLEKDVIQNKFITTLDLSENRISEIADGALENMNLKDDLRLDGNKLKATTFAATLPVNLTKLSLRDNEITEVTAGSLSTLAKLTNLKLDGNKISAIQRHSLQGLPALRFLTLTNNGLRSIEPFSFEAQTFLRVLDLGSNQLTGIQKDLFTGLDILLSLNISDNKIAIVNQQTMAGLHYTIHTLFMGHNGIESLAANSFVNVPILDLSLDGNKISKIDKGTFDLPYLRLLNLKDNQLGAINGDSFEGLGSLKTLSLAGNGITQVKKGAAKNLGSLIVLDISSNPITKLENGALYGLQKSGQRSVKIANAPVEQIQGGVFDDV